MRNYRVLMTVFIIGIFAFTGCNGMYGKISYNPEHVKSFQTKSLLPDYNYYYCGRSNLPYAVIGIDKQYTFNDRVWFAIQTKEEIFDKIDKLNYAPDNDYRLIGADMLDAAGHKIGIWYSFYSHTVVKQSPDNVLDVFNPYKPHHYHYHYSLTSIMCREKIYLKINFGSPGAVENKMMDISSKSVLLTRMFFGKHKGEFFKDIPQDYLKWLSGTELDEDMRFTVEHYLK